MTFSASALELLAGGGNGICLWGYKTTDPAATVDTSGYFNSAVKQLSVGDRIHLQCVESGSTVTFGLAVVVSNDGTDVDIADMTALGGTNSD